MKALFVSLALLMAGSLHAADSAPAVTQAQPDIFVSGFEPFGGRSENASWVVASSIAKAQDGRVKAIQVPVEWDAPLKVLRATQTPPRVWIAFGEGTNKFKIETFARNERGNIEDNKGQKPLQKNIIESGSDILKHPTNFEKMAVSLSAQGFPTQVSQNAGQYLCEEMLYSLLYHQASSSPKTELVMFVHVPILGGQISTAQGGKVVNQELLDQFGKAILKEVEALLPAKE